MGWSGRAPAPPVTNLARGSKDKEHAMSQNLNSAVAMIGIDIGKNSFHVVGLDDRGAIVAPTALRHFSRQDAAPTVRVRERQVLSPPFPVRGFLLQHTAKGPRRLVVRAARDS